MVTIQSRFLAALFERPLVFFFVRLTNLILLIFSVTLVVSSPHMGSIVTSAGLLITYVLGDGYFHLRYRQMVTYREIDQRVLGKLLECLPSDGSMEFLRKLEHSAPYKDDVLRDVYRFLSEWEDNPRLRFSNAELEDARQELHRALQAYAETFGANSFSHRNPKLTGWSEVPRVWRQDDPDRYREVHKTLDSLAMTAVEKYDSLLDLARSYAVDPRHDPSTT